MKTLVKVWFCLCLLVLGGIAHAEMLASVCWIGSITDACNSNDNVADKDVLLIHGYAYDSDNIDVPAGKGTITVTNLDTGLAFLIPISQTEARPEIIIPYLEKNPNPAIKDFLSVVNIGFVGKVFTASLPPGRYSVTSVTLSMKSGAQKTLTLNADQKGSFTVNPTGLDGVSLIDSSGTRYPLRLTQDNYGNVSVTGYPPLRDGNYVIEAAIGGGAKKQVSFTYARPIVTLKYSIPIAKDFPGIENTFTINNPLTKRQIIADLNTTVDDTGGLKGFSISGNELTQGSNITLVADTKRGYNIARIVETAHQTQSGNIRLFVNLPDAPHIVLNIQSWHPKDVISTSVSQTTIPIKVEDLLIDNTLVQNSSDKCQSLTTIWPGMAYGNIYGTVCAIQWTQKPDTMASDSMHRNGILGQIQNLGDNVLSFLPGVLAKDPATYQTQFYPGLAGETSVVVQGIEPKPIKVDFTQDASLTGYQKKINAIFPGKYIAIADKTAAGIAGYVDVTGAHRGVSLKVTYPNGEEKTNFTSRTTLRSYLTPLLTAPWATGTVKVIAWYDKAPEYNTELSLDFVGYPKAPSVTVDRNTSSHNMADTIVTGKLGTPQGKDLVFDPSIMGSWQVVVKDIKGNVYGSPAIVQPDATFAVNLGKMDKGAYQMVAVGQPLSSDGQVADDEAVTRRFDLTINDGTPITGKVSARVATGAIPMFQNVYFAADGNRDRDLASINWESAPSPDGPWTRIKDGGGQTDLNRHNYNFKQTDSGVTYYRAITTNKYSGLTYTTDAFMTHAYNVPDFSIDGPVVSAQNTPVTLTLKRNDNVNAIFHWEVTKGGAVTDVSGADSETFTFTPQDRSTYTIKITAMEAGAPTNDPGAVKVKMWSVRVVDPLIARATINGPRFVEVGKTYTYTATINDVTNNKIDKNYTLKGFWMLPDGTRVDSNQIDYTIQPGDTSLSFYTYIDGQPDRTSVAVFPLQTWTYQWPQQWNITLTPVFLDVPARIGYRINPVDVKLSALNGEPLTVIWSVPDHVTQQASDSMSGFLNIDAPGTYQIQAQIKDTRGNVTNVSSNQFTILPRAQIETQMIVNSPYGNMYYAPGTYYVQLKILQLPRGDSFSQNEVYLNGEKVGTFTGGATNVTFAQPGDYNLTIRTITKSGAYGEQSQQLTLADPPAPTCSINNTASRTAVNLITQCQVAVGYVRSYKWTYELDGVAQQTSSKNFSILSSWLAKGSIKNVTFTAESDLGKTYTETIDLSTLPQPTQ